MNISGLDRVVVMVRDLDKALAFFSGTLGMDFQELTKDISVRDGVRSHVCHHTHLHLISPILPLPPDAAPPMRQRIGLLKDHESVIMAITFRVDDTAVVEADLAAWGIGIQHRYEPSGDYATIGMDRFAEIVTRAQDTFGLVIGFASYDSTCVHGDTSNVDHSSGRLTMKVTGLDRIIVFVRDMDKALEFFSGKLGMTFKELDKTIQLRDGNRGMVCPETHLHLVQPFDPLPETAPPPMKQAAQLLKEKEALVMMLIFKVDDAKKGIADMKQAGFSILRVWDENQDYASLGMGNMVEFLVDPKNTLGVPFAFSTWERI